MIEAILWDFGGVITTSPFEAFNRFEAERGLPRDFIRGVNATNPRDNAWARLEQGRMSLDEFDEAFAREAEAAGHRVAGREVIALLYGDVRPRMVEVLKACKARFKVACITNNLEPHGTRSSVVDGGRMAGVAEVMALFDLVVQSSVEGIRKPDPRIYEIACERLGAAPEASVFLDDLGINLKPARALGMRTIKVESEDQAIRELAEVTGLDLG